MTANFDVAIVGGGPNGLTAAAYLARAGARVAVLERRFERGGTMMSDDYSTPFTYNQAQAALPLGADNPVVAELGLADQGVAFIEPSVAAEVPGELVVGRGGAGLGDAVRAMFASVGRACVPALYRAPEPEPSLVAGWRSRGEGAAADLADLTPGGLAALAASGPARLAVRYACAASGFSCPDERIGAVGGFMIARWFSPVLVAGGSKNLPNALFRLAASAGADCHVSARVTRVRRSGPGFALSCRDGRQIGARDVICTLDPRTTFTGLLDPALVPASLAAAGRDWAVDDLGCFTAHFGIAGLPPVSRSGVSRSGGEPYLRLVGFSSVQDLDDHLAAVRGGRRPERPAGLLSVTTAHDPLQASPGPYGPLHTLRFDSFAPLNHPDGPWDRHRRHYRARCWEFLCDQFPALREAHLIAQFADAPGDLRRRFATTGAGTVRQGALSPAQALTLRPYPSCADTRTPVPGFYLGGGGVHPGVPGLLGAGMLAARAVMADPRTGRPGGGPAMTAPYPATTRRGEGVTADGEFYMPTRVFFGRGVAGQGGAHAAGLAARRVMLVTDPGVQAAGLADPVRDQLVSAGLEVADFQQVKPNPRDVDCLAGADLAADTVSCPPALTAAAGMDALSHAVDALMITTRSVPARKRTRSPGRLTGGSNRKDPSADHGTFMNRLSGDGSDGAPPARPGRDARG